MGSEMCIRDSIGAVLLVACKYIKEAFTKFVAILNAKTEGGIENE